MANTSQKKLRVVQKEYLEELGLSSDAIEVYELLVGFGPLTAQEVATRTFRYASAQYRLFYQLESFGLVRREGLRPLRFAVLPIENGFAASFAVKEQTLSRLLTQSLKGNTASEDIPRLRLIMGRQALYAEYARLAPLAKHTIDAYTIGIAYSDELVAVQRSAIKRGVRIRHVIQQLKPSNFHVAHTWQRLGVHLRFSRAERGFHLMIFDDTSAIVTFSDPSNTDDRISLVIETSAAAQVFIGYFSAIWLAAREVDA